MTRVVLFRSERGILGVVGAYCPEYLQSTFEWDFLAKILKKSYCHSDIFGKEVTFSPRIQLVGRKQSIYLKISDNFGPE